MKNDSAKKRSGTVLALVVLLLFVLIVVAGLLIDVGMARLTQLRMQAIADAAAIEGGWQMAMETDDTLARQAVVGQAQQMAENLGAGRIELDAGYDLNGDGTPESSQMINRDALTDPVVRTLDLNVGNADAGDIVLGRYDADAVPTSLPGQPSNYERGPAFVSDAANADAILVRLRDTGEVDLPGGTSGDRLVYLWSRGSIMDFGLKGSGIAVRAESIVKLMSAVAVGWADNDELPGLLQGVAVRRSSLASASYQASDLAVVQDAYWIGVRADDQTPVALPAAEGFFYLPIVDEVSVPVSDLRVVGFTLIEKTGDQLTRVTFDQTEFEHKNVSASLAVISKAAEAFGESVPWEDAAMSDVIRINASLDPQFAVTAPRLVRSHQIQGGSP